MKLRYSTTSPYVRKVVVTAAEAGLSDRIELVPTNPSDPKTDLARDNPLGKVPALITDDGATLFDSPVICEYLDGLHAGRKLIPPSGPERWKVLRQQALADGILDAAVLCVSEGRRREELRSSDWVERQKGKIARALDALEAEAAELADEATIGTLTIACALGYLDFRLPKEDWRPGRARLGSWYERFHKRPSMVASVPREPA